MHYKLLGTALLSTFLTACMVGPNFHSPTPPSTKKYTHTPLPSKTIAAPRAGVAGKAQQFGVGRDIPAAWWYVFHSPVINQLIKTGLANSPTLAAAEAALREAQENLNAQLGAAMLPAVNLQLNTQRQRFNAASLGTPSASIFNLVNASVPITYTLDTFGGARRELEALRDQVDYQRFELDAAYLTLTSNIVTTAITAASLQAQIDATHELITAQADLLVAVRGQFEHGAISRANVLSQESQLAQTKASLPPLVQSLDQANHALAVLVGEFPSDVKPVKLSLANLNLPTQLPMSLPSALVRQRPDILASEALLAAASAQIGVATANLFPQITLSANYGWTNNSFSKLFTASNSVWAIGSNLLQPVFRGGSLRATRRAAIAAYEQAAAQYRQTVLQAFQNVADTLTALQHDAQTLRNQKDAEMAARNAFVLTRGQFRLGSVDYLSLLNAEVQYQNAKIARIRVEATRFNDTAALFQALGGGWWNRK